MNKNEKKKMLTEYNQLCMNIQALKDRREELFTSATKITSGQSDVMPSNRDNKSRVETQSIKLKEIEDRIKAKENIKNSIDREMSKLSYKDRLIIRYIYIDKVPCKRLSGILKKDYQYINKRANKAISTMVL